MIRWYIKYKIRSSIDRLVRLPRWVQSRLDGDAELTRYAKNYARVMQQLSSAAETWMQEQTNEERPGWSQEVSALVQSFGANARLALPQPESGPRLASQPRFANSTSLRWAVCLAATLVLTSGMLLLRARSNRNLAGHESARNAEIAVTATRAVWEKGQSVADQSLVVWDRTLDKLSRNLADRIGETAVTPIEDGSRWLGEAIQELHNGALREQNSLLEMSKRVRNRFEALKSQ